MSRDWSTYEPPPLAEQFEASRDARAIPLRPPPQFGVYDENELPMADYLKIDAVRGSLLRNVHDSGPEHADHMRKFRDEGTSSMSLGTVAHSALLDPENFERTHRVRETKGEGVKAAMRDWEADGYTLITATERDAALFIRDAVHRHSRAKALLENAWHRELTFCVPVQTKHGQLTAVTRIDLVTKQGMAVHIKTAGRDGWRRAQWPSTVVRQRYEMTREFYRLCERQLLAGGYESARVHGVTEPSVTHAFLVIESSPPHRVNLYEMGDASATIAADYVRWALDDWAEWRSLDADEAARRKWDSEEVQGFDLPQWEFDRYNLERERRGEA